MLFFTIKSFLLEIFRNKGQKIVINYYILEKIQIFLRIKTLN
jgi:hypothetical protein